MPGLGLHSPRLAVVQHAVTAPGTGGLLAQAEDRSAAVVTAWLTAQPQGWRRGITHVAIDLSASYAKAVREGYLMRCWSRTASTSSVSPTTP